MRRVEPCRLDFYIPPRGGYLEADLRPKKVACMMQLNRLAGNDQLIVSLCACLKAGLFLYGIYVHGLTELPRRRFIPKDNEGYCQAWSGLSAECHCLPTIP